MTPDTVQERPADGTSPRGNLSRGRSAGTLTAVVLILVVLAGALSLAMPFWGDQALFTVYGRQLSDGAVLYRDVFDLKQPGIFVFYTVGGLLFGFTEVGIRLFELAYWLAFSVFALVALRPYFTARWAAALVPVFTVVVYYLTARTLDLTQTEALVAFPILLAWWLIDQADPGTRRGLRWYAAAGVTAAAVVLLKHLYVLIIVAFLGYALFRSRRQRIPAADFRRALLLFSVGLIVPLLIVAAYFAAHGQLGRIWWAYFEYALQGKALDPEPFSHFTSGGRRFLVAHAPLVILAAVGCARGLRQRIGPQVDLAAGMALWGVAGIVTLYVQFWATWHWLLFTVPLGILAALGVEALPAMGGSLRKALRPTAIVVGSALVVLGFLVGDAAPQHAKWLLVPVATGVGAGATAALLADRPHVRRWTVPVLVGVLAASVGVMAVAPVGKLQALVEHDFALTADARDDFQRSWNDTYRTADEDLATLQGGDVLAGPIHVFGDPVVLLRANRPQAVPIHGWGPEKFDARAWQELHRDLHTTLPPYIVVDGFSESVIRSRHPALLEFVEAEYEVAFVGASGTWYVRR